MVHRDLPRAAARRARPVVRGGGLQHRPAVLHRHPPPRGGRARAPRPAGGGGSLDAATAGVIVTALATAMFSVNGYDSAINFSEETGGSASQVGKAVVVAASVGIVCELVPFIATVFGAPDLHGFLTSSTPLTDVIDSAFGHTVVDIVTGGAIIAIFNASLAITLQFARITWSTGRDRAWPPPVSNALSRVNANGAPWVATLIIGACATILCLES